MATIMVDVVSAEESVFSGEADFVALRDKRDATLPLPKLMLHALQVNIRGGRLPEPDGNGVSYLRVPLNAMS